MAIKMAGKAARLATVAVIFASLGIVTHDVSARQSKIISALPSEFFINQDTGLTRIKTIVNTSVPRRNAQSTDILSVAVIYAGGFADLFDETNTYLGSISCEHHLVPWLSQEAGVQIVDSAPRGMFTATIETTYDLTGCYAIAQKMHKTAKHIKVTLSTSLATVIKPRDLAHVYKSGEVRISQLGPELVSVGEANASNHTVTQTYDYILKDR